MYKTASDWLQEPKYKSVVIFDPYGWRGRNRSWEDPVTEEEFQARLNESTICLNRSN